MVAQLGVDYIDLYLIHSPRLATPDIPTAWKKMEDLKDAGLVKYVSHLSSMLSPHAEFIVAMKEHWGQQFQR